MCSMLTFAPHTLTHTHTSPSQSRTFRAQMAACTPHKHKALSCINGCVRLTQRQIDVIYLLNECVEQAKERNEKKIRIKNCDKQKRKYKQKVETNETKRKRASSVLQNGKFLSISLLFLRSPSLSSSVCASVTVYLSPRI